jgi:hypothetical protein
MLVPVNARLSFWAFVARASLAVGSVGGHQGALVVSTMRRALCGSLISHCSLACGSDSAPHPHIKNLLRIPIEDSEDLVVVVTFGCVLFGSIHVGDELYTPTP